MAASRLGSLCTLNFRQLTRPGPICTRCFNNVIQSNSRPSQLWNNPFRKFHQKSRQGAHLRVRENDTVTFRYIIKPLGFSVLFSGSCFLGGMVWQYELMRLKAQKIINNWISADGHDIFHPKSYAFRSHLNMWWNSMSDGQKYVLGIIGANALVFIMWRIPSLQANMMKYFCSNPNSGAPCWSMFLSAFSQYSFIHMFTNMYVLWSFSNVALNLFGKEQFMAFYFSAATVSSLFSYSLKIARQRFIPSVGASGALMAVLGAVCLNYPNARLSIAFIGDIIPHSFSADSVLKVIIATDIIGILAGWKLFDHAAHLGGMMFGLWYATYGKKLIWENRATVQKWWHEVRGDP